MRVPLSWLAEYVPLAMPVDELATRLSIASAEVEGIETRGVADSDGNLYLMTGNGSFDPNAKQFLQDVANLATED